MWKWNTQPKDPFSNDFLVHRVSVEADRSFASKKKKKKKGGVEEKDESQMQVRFSVLPLSCFNSIPVQSDFPKLQSDTFLLSAIKQQ